MASPRVCPHCRQNIPTDRDFSFDENLNLICGNCGKIVFPTTAEAEREVFQQNQPLPRQKSFHEDIPEG